MTSKKNIISFINMKGGVGKTTLCVSLAYQLSKVKNKKVLIIDMDPQFNATQSMMEEYNLVDDYLNVYRKERTIIKIFDRKKTLSGSEGSKEVTPEDIIIKSEVNPKLDVICGNIDLIFEDTNQDNMSRKRLKLFIDKYDLQDEYDFIFIDCPPTISFFTDTALIASNYYLIPVKIDKFSVLGVRMLDNVIALMKEDPDNKIDCLGIVYTMQEQQKKLEDIKEVFEGTEIVKNYYIFSNTMLKHNHLLSGSQGNIAYNYDATRENVNLISEEFLWKINEVEDDNE